ncbi:OB-fold nucleic acid binding domain-containing protein [Flexivirga meconopsidis]|uniref:OB-fold nucleic acid binding domain-containing protein n=1 Tax=Flexivirga meconopsidis TaxID=2977121 RepID=UPI0022401708|nr:OB-fold nucleic acid binding domain-containing protein [Flexivirga meconopsidis]
MSLKTSFGKVADRLTRSETSLERDELREAARKHGATPICDATDRSMASCCGTVRSVSLRPRSGTVPAMVVDLDDGSRTMNLVWLGRRRIGGIEPGVYLKVKGRVTYLKGVPTIFNPAYEIKQDR